MIWSCTAVSSASVVGTVSPAASNAAGLYQTSDLTLIEYGRPNVWPSTTAMSPRPFASSAVIASTSMPRSSSGKSDCVWLFSTPGCG